MKKVLSLVLAIAMVLSMTTVAFAGTFEDVTDANTVKAVEALTALGLVNGYEDGTFKPDRVVTRAEMAKMLVIALGHEGLVEGSTTSFKDAQGKWYEGYVSIASGLKIINGYPDGTFKGDNAVSYAEASVMILRALGYTNATVNGGIDSYNVTAYKTMASKLGILNNVVFKATGANRGDIAKMLYNALEARTVVTNDKGKAEEIVISETVDKETGKITKDYETLLDRVATKETVKVTPASLDSDSKSYLGDLVDLAPYMYQSLVVYTNKDGNVVFVKASNSDTVEGTFAKNKEAEKVNVVVSSTKTEIVKVPANNADVKVFLNGKEVKLSEDVMEAAKTGKQVGLVGADVTVVFDADGNVEGMVATQATRVVRIANEYISGKVTLNGKDIKLPLNDDDKVDLTKLTITGDATTLEDIKEDDIVSLYVPAGTLDTTAAPEKLTLVVTRDVVEGKISKIDGSKLYIDGTAYTKASVEGVTDHTFALKDEGTFFLNEDGKIVDFDVKGVVATNYAIVTKVVNGETSQGGRVYDAEITMLNAKGEKAVYKVVSTAKLTGIDAEDNDTVVDKVNTTVNDKVIAHYEFDSKVKENILVKYAVNADGEITALNIVDNDTTTVSTRQQDTTDKNFIVSSNVIVFNLKDNGAYEVVSADKLAKLIDITAKVESASTGEVTVLVVKGLGSSTGTYAYITKKVDAVNGSDVNAFLITAIVDGEEVQFYTVDQTVAIPAVDKGAIYKLSFTGDEVSSVTTESAIEATADFEEVAATNGNRFKVNDTWYTLADNAMVIVLDADGTFDYVGDASSLRGSAVQMYNTVDNGTNVVAIVVVK